MRSVLIVTIIASISFFLVSCITGEEAQVPPAGEGGSSTTETVVQNPVSPMSPIPSPVSETEVSQPPEQVDIPEPDSGFGTVGGILLVKTPEEEIYKPLSINPVYLAPLIYNEDGSSYFAGLDFETDPTATTTQTGVFIIQGVPAGSYGFVVMRGVTPYLVKDENGKDIIVTVEPDSVVDLEEIRAELPPL